MLLEVGLDGPSELSHQFQHADLEEAVEEGLVALEESNDEVLVDEVVEGLLLDGALRDFLGLELVGEGVGDLVGPAVEGDGDVEAVLEEVVGRVHVERDQVELHYLGVEVAGEVEVPELEGVERVSLLVDSHLQLQLQPADELVGDVLLGRAVVEQLREHLLELHASLLLHLLQLALQAGLELLEILSLLGLLEAPPEVDGVLAVHQLPPDGADQRELVDIKGHSACVLSHIEQQVQRQSIP